MNDEPEQERPLGPGAGAVLQAWVASRQPLRPPRAAAPGTEPLVRYLCGMLAPGAAREVEQGLIAHAAARARLREARAELDVLQAVPWAEMAERGRGDGFAAEVAHAWLGVVAEQAAAVPAARAWWLARGWAEARRGVEAGAAEALAAWGAVRAFTAEMVAGLRAPRAALARGESGGRVQVSGEPPGGVELSLVEAEVSRDGDLRVVVAALDEARKPSAALSGRSAGLALVWEGEWWPMGGSVFAGERLQWEAPGMGSELGLPAGSLPVSCLRVVLSPGEAPGEPRALAAPVLDERGRRLGVPAPVLELVEAPRWEGGEFRAAIALPRATRAAYPDHCLRLELVVSPRSSQRLGIWPLREWGDGPIELVAACPGSPAAVLPVASFLRAAIVPGAGKAEGP